MDEVEILKGYIREASLLSLNSHKICPSVKLVSSYPLCQLFFSDYRDQGLTRPKVLIVVPFRESAKRVIELMIQILCPTDQVNC